MAAIRIEDPRLNRDLDRLAKAQPARTSKQAMAEAILREGVAFCRSNPVAWMQIGNPAAGSTSGQSDSDAAGSIRPATITSAQKRASSSSSVAAEGSPRSKVA